LSARARRAATHPAVDDLPAIVGRLPTLLVAARGGHVLRHAAAGVVHAICAGRASPAVDRLAAVVGRGPAAPGAPSALRLALARIAGVADRRGRTVCVAGTRLPAVVRPRATVGVAPCQIGNARACRVVTRQCWGVRAGFGNRRDVWGRRGFPGGDPFDGRVYARRAHVHKRATTLGIPVSAWAREGVLHAATILELGRNGCTRSIRPKASRLELDVGKRAPRARAPSRP
jgi:hypothetical protein